jgi:eukaryotic-like serine/threonine-protein kinase
MTDKKLNISIISASLFTFIVFAGLAIFPVAGVLLKIVCVAGCLASVYIILTVKGKKEPPEESRMLGLSYQNQGSLDKAFDKFQLLPIDDDSKELIYAIGNEYENKNQPDDALKVYLYIARKGGYKDVKERIRKLKGSVKTPSAPSIVESNEVTRMQASTEKVRTRIGRYEILGVLGKGSMGLVYKAQDPKINRLVAIKTIRFSDEFEEDIIHEIKERFFREAEIAGQLSHPAIVTIHDVGEDDDLTYMAMEFLEGEDLDNFITKGKLLSFRRVIDVVVKIAEALDYAHKANVIHRDIKPANVMLLKNGNIKVTDFGIAKAISSSRTKTGVILGTPNYMSPEQIMGQKIDARSDIFSLGVLFYQLITGELPFHGDNLSGLLYQITQIKHPSPRSYNPKIPSICEQILDKALAKDPSKRFKSAGEMAKVINLLGQRIDQIRIQKSSIILKGTD